MMALPSRSGTEDFIALSPSGTAAASFSGPSPAAINRRGDRSGRSTSDAAEPQGHAHAVAVSAPAYTMCLAPPPLNTPLT